MGAGSEPFVFHGEHGIDARLKGGPVIDFNVMTRRSACTHLLEVAELQGTRLCTLRGDLMLVYVAQGGRISCQDMHADVGEAILADRHEEPEIELTALSPAVLCVAHITFKEKRDE
jgi:environmental stress-induced protein Ves